MEECIPSTPQRITSGYHREMSCFKSPQRWKKINFIGEILALKHLCLKDSIHYHTFELLPSIFHSLPMNAYFPFLHLNFPSSPENQQQQFRDRKPQKTLLNFPQQAQEKNQTRRKLANIFLSNMYTRSHTVYHNHMHTPLALALLGAGRAC